MKNLTKFLVLLGCTIAPLAANDEQTSSMPKSETDLIVASSKGDVERVIALLKEGAKDWHTFALRFAEKKRQEIIDAMHQIALTVKQEKPHLNVDSYVAQLLMSNAEFAKYTHIIQALKEYQNRPLESAVIVDRPVHSITTQPALKVSGYVTSHEIGPVFPKIAARKSKTNTHRAHCVELMVVNQNAPKKEVTIESCAALIDALKAIQF